MPVKVIDVAGIGPVHFSKRRGSRSMRISIHGSVVKVSMPYWTPYAAGKAFVDAKKDWVLANRTTTPNKLYSNGMAIGKAHHLQFKPGVNVASRVTKTLITITVPATMQFSDAAVQEKTKQAIIRALRSQAEQLLPQRLARLADQFGYHYRSVAIKQLKRRWGSCDQHKNIVFNLFLLELPWELIDYVILHELAHTKYLNHSADFWDEMALTVGDPKAIRKRMRAYQPQL